LPTEFCVDLRTSKNVFEIRIASILNLRISDKYLNIIVVQ